MTRPGSDRDAYEYSGRGRWGDRLCRGRQTLPDSEPQTQAVGAKLLRAPCQDMRPALPESFVQGDALGFVLTEVQLRHTVVDHLITQLPWKITGKRN